MMFPFEEVCGGKGLIDKCPSSSLYLAFLVIIHDQLFPSGISAGQQESEERRGPHGDWLDVPN
jgi:hypothetical protein